MEKIVQSQKLELGPQPTVADQRQAIEVGWRQSESGEVVDGPYVFAEIRKTSEQMLGSAEGK